MNKTIKNSPEIIEALTKLGFSLTDKHNLDSPYHGLSFWERDGVYITEQDIEKDYETFNLLDRKDLLMVFKASPNGFRDYISILALIETPELLEEIINSNYEQHK